MANQYTLNPEGLTSEEWINAATYGVQGDLGVTRRRLLKAWREGEDPTEWCAYFQNKQREEAKNK